MAKTNRQHQQTHPRPSGRPAGPAPEPVFPVAPVAVATTQAYPREGLAKFTDAAKFLGVSVQTLRGLVKDGEFETVVVGKRPMLRWPDLHAKAEGKS